MSLLTKDYAAFLAEVKSQIKSSQAKAALAVNASLIAMYWNIGEMIAENQTLFEGRNDFIERLANDIKAEFPEISGFSRTNLFSIRQFYLFYSQNSVQQLVGLSEIAQESVQQAVGLLGNEENPVQQAVALNEKTPEILKLLVQIPWGHHIFNFNESERPRSRLFLS